MARKTIYRKNSSNGLDNTDLVIPTSSDLNKLDSIEYGAQKNPTLATVAMSGSYNDLKDKPTIPSIPNLATVATTGSYNDLSNKPTIPSIPSITVKESGNGFVSDVSSNGHTITVSKSEINHVDTSDRLNRIAIGYNRPVDSGGLGKRWFRFAHLEAGANHGWFGRENTFEIFTNGYNDDGMTYIGKLCIQLNCGNQDSLKKEFSDCCYTEIFSKAIYSDLIRVCSVCTDTTIDFFIRNNIWDSALYLTPVDNGDPSFTLYYDQGDLSKAYTDDEFEQYKSGKLVKEASLSDKYLVHNSIVSDLLSGFHTDTSKFNWASELGSNVNTSATANGGILAYKEKDGKLNVAINGAFYQNDGKYKVIDENTLKAGTGLSLNGTTFNVKTGFTSSGKNYAVQADNKGNLYVNVPWTDTDTNTTYSAGTGLSLNGTTFNVKTGFTSNGKNYAVQADNKGNLYVNVPWTDTNSGGTVTSVSIKLNGIVQGTITHSGTINLGYIDTGNVESKGTQGSDATDNGEQGYYWLKDSSNMWLEIAYGCVSTSGDNSYTYVTFSKTFNRVPAVVMTMLDSRSTQTINYRNGQAINGTPTKYGFFFDAGNSENHKYAWIAIAVY